MRCLGGGEVGPRALLWVILGRFVEAVDPWVWREELNTGNIELARSGSEFEVDPLSLKFLVSRTIEAVEAGGAAGDVLFDFVGLGEDIEFGDFLAKVALVESLFEDEFVEVLKLGEGEFFGKEFEADGLVADFSAEA